MPKDTYMNGTLAMYNDRNCLILDSFSEKDNLCSCRIVYLSDLQEAIVAAEKLKTGIEPSIAEENQIRTILYEQTCREMRIKTFLETERYMPFLKYYSDNILTICCGNELLFIGCGAPADQIFYEIRQIYPAKAIIGILLLHNQRDHIRSAEKISRRCQIPVLGTEKNLIYCCFAPDVPVIPIKRGEASVGGFQVETFPIHYDAPDAVGSVVSFGEKAVGIVIDGKLMEDSCSVLKKCTHIFLSNCRPLSFQRRLPQSILKRRKQLYPTRQEQAEWLKKNDIITPIVLMKDRFF